VLVDLLQPVTHICESRLDSAVVCKYNALGSFVISLGDSSEPLLSGRVPYLQLQILAVNVDCLNFEVNSWIQVMVGDAYQWWLCERD